MLTDGQAPLDSRRERPITGKDPQTLLASSCMSCLHVVERPAPSSLSHYSQRPYIPLKSLLVRRILAPTVHYQLPDGCGGLWFENRFESVRKSVRNGVAEAFGQTFGSYRKAIQKVVSKSLSKFALPPGNWAQPCAHSCRNIGRKFNLERVSQGNCTALQ